MEHTQFPAPGRLLSEIKVRHVANLFIIVSVFVALGTTLYPFDFTTYDVDNRLGPFISPAIGDLRSLRDDAVTNIILFLPVGFSFGILATRKDIRPLFAFVLVTLAGGLLSFLVEVLQLFLPFRYSSLFDVASNALGSSLGYLLYKGFARLTYQTLTSAVERANSGRALGWVTGGYIIYLAVMLLGSIPLQQSSFIAEFNKSTYPLVIGNEPTGNRPWVGAIKELVVAKYPFSQQGISEFLTGTPLNSTDQKDVVARYNFSGGGPYRDVTRLHAPLEWKGNNPDSSSREEARLSSNGWLQTKNEAYEMSSWLMETLRFTICLHVASRDSRDAYMARILSVSSDPYHQNISVVQIGRDLAVRFRSMTTGLNGTNPQFLIPGVFADTLWHRIVISLAPSQLRVYIDDIDQQYSIDLGPGFAMLNQFFPSNGKLYISSPMKNFHRVLYEIIVFVPLGYLIAVLVAESRRGILVRILIACIGVIAPPVLLEHILCNVAGRTINIDNLSIGFALMFGTVLATLTSRLVRIHRSSAP